MTTKSLSKLARPLLIALYAFIFTPVVSAGIKIEVFIDGDSGYGSGIIYNGQPGDNSFEIPMKGVSVGAHVVSFRVKDDKEFWSTTITKVLYVFVPQKGGRSSIEWFFDKDPGIGLASQKEVSAGNNTVMISTENLTPGAHIFSSRVSDENGKWSSTITHPLFVSEKVAKIIAAEYFVDSDPGNGKGNPVIVSDDGGASFIVPTSDISVGLHNLTLRGRDTSNKWYELFSAPFSVVENNGVSSVEWKMQFNIYREGNNLRLDAKDIEDGSEITIVDLQGIVMYESELIGNSEPQIIPINPSNDYVIVSIKSPNGLRSVKLVKI